MDIFQDPIVLLIAGLLFLAVFLGVESFLIWWNSTHSAEAKRITMRIQSLSASGGQTGEQASLLKERLLVNSSPLQRLLLSLPRLSSIDRQLVLSGKGWSVSVLLIISFVTCIVTLLVTSSMRLPLVAVMLFGLVALIAPYRYICWVVTKRMKRFEELLPDTMDLIGRAMRAGHALPTALQMVGDEMPDPIGPEFRLTFDEINYGIDTSTALQNLAHRIPSMDLNFFVIAVLIQRESGGNLGEILGNISKIIRERLVLLGKARTLSAEGRMSAWVLSLLPPVTAFFLYLANPNVMQLLWTEKTGQVMLTVAIIMMMIGVLWIRAIVRIKI